MPIRLNKIDVFESIFGTIGGKVNHHFYDIAKVDNYKRLNSNPNKFMRLEILLDT